MPKEQFERSNTHRNIGDINYIEHGKTTTEKAFERASEIYKNHDQMVLLELIERYGEEKGRKYFEILRRESEEGYKDFQNIDVTQEEKEDGVNISRRR